MILEVAVIVLGLLWAVTLWLFVSHVRRQRVLAAQQVAGDEQRDRRLRELARRLDTYQNGNVQMGEDLHELRRTQATLLQDVVSPKAAQHRLGHSQISMTMNTYAHFLDAEDIAVAEAMDDILKPKAK